MNYYSHEDNLQQTRDLTSLSLAHYSKLQECCIVRMLCWEAASILLRQCWEQLFHLREERMYISTSRIARPVSTLILQTTLLYLDGREIAWKWPIFNVNRKAVPH